MLNVSGITLTFNQPSEINGMPIGTLLQVGSNNQKTGYSLQTVYFPTAKTYPCHHDRIRRSCMW